MIRFSRRDLLFIAICLVIFGGGLAIGLRYFNEAFPEASIDFKVDRRESRAIAETFLRARGLDTGGMRGSAQFEHDSTAKIFLERTLGLEKANRIMGSSVRLWYWRHRWFVPLEREEYRVDVAPSGEIVSFAHFIAEEAAAPSAAEPAARAAGESFLRSVGADPATLTFIGSSERRLPKRVETTFTWEAKDLRPGGAPYRFTVTTRGTAIASYSQALRVPDAWQRDYTNLRSKNMAAGAVDQIFMTITAIAALVVFILRTRRGDLKIRFTLWSAAIGALLVMASALNEFPSALAGYDTRQSFPAFVTGYAGSAIMQGVMLGLLLMIIVGAGEALYRERYPSLLGMPRLFGMRALRSRRVFLGFLLGYTLFAGFLAYQVLFYIVATKYGAWSPADIPYDTILNTAFPWMAVLFMGFFPAMSEEFLSRAFSIPFFSRVLRSPIAAIIAAGFIWGFGHAAYPNQPFFIRGIEVGVAGVVIGLLMFRYGLLPLLVWHYTVDALYTSLLLFRSGNTYYVLSAAFASLVFAIPMIVSLVLYFRNGGFEPDEELSNGAIGTAPEVPREIAPSEGALPVDARPLRVWHVAAAVLAIAAAAALIAAGRRDEPVINYAIDGDEATAIAKQHLASRAGITLPARNVARPAAGFRSWDEESGSEDGGSPGDYDVIAAEYMLRKDVPIQRIGAMQRESVEAATWVVRFFTPQQKEEIFVEVDPRTRRATGFHRYLDEAAPGARLARGAAEAITMREFARYGLDPAAFELREAHVFQQPARLDWLFHFQERRPLGAEAFRRVSIRVAGDQVTQFAKTVKIPEHEFREATRQTLLRTILVIAKILGGLLLLGLVITGAVYAIRRNRFRWRPAAVGAAIFAPLVLASMATRYTSVLQNYDTSIAWSTFLVTVSVGAAFMVAGQVGGAFLGLTVIESGFPEARGLASGRGRRAVGASAVMLGLAAAGIIFAQSAAADMLPHWLPKFTPLQTLVIPSEVADTLPVIGALCDAILIAILGCGVVAMLAVLGRENPESRRIWHALAAVSIFLLALDAGANDAQMPVAVLRALVATAVIYAVPVFLLRDNLLAYPAAMLTLVLVGTGLNLLGNDRADLKVHGALMIGIVVLFLAWLVSGRRERVSS
ncbi:MAG: CPBP family glutamic-type intramembrane protease [Thermoanaerobaculia bacterium]